MPLTDDQAQTAAPHNPMPTPDSGPGDGYVDRMIALDLIDPPSIAERETMEEQDLAELAMDILAIGLTNPITVYRRGERYEVIAGHRRYLACGLAGLTFVPCRVKMGNNIDPLAILVSENAHREPVNPVQEARFYQRVLIERAGNDVDRLVELVKRRREHVEDRLILLQQHPKLVAAVERKQISLAVARELAKCTDEGRLLILLDVSIQSGATARLVAEWRKKGAELGDVQVPPPDSAEGGASTSSSSEPYRMECVFCEGADYPHLMQMLWVHSTCMTMLLRLLHRDPPSER